MTYAAALAITTHNRKDELPAAVDSALEQSIGERLHVVIIDDGSSDGTSEMLDARYGHLPNVSLHARHPGIGLIAERNTFPELCDAPYIVSMDDDAVFPSRHTVEQTIDDFNQPGLEDTIGAIAIPYIDVNIEPDTVHQSPPAADGRLYAAEQYRGTAHAIRKDIFVRLGRYRGQLWRQGEEGDYCIRLYNAGYAVTLGTADPIHHLESPKRSKQAIFTYATRNNIWFAWHNVPKADLPKHLLGTTAMHLLDGVKNPGRLGARLRGVAQGYAGVLGAERTERRAVSRGAYRLSRDLRASGPVPLDTLTDRLAELRAAFASA